MVSGTPTSEYFEEQNRMIMLVELKLPSPIPFFHVVQCWAAAGLNALLSVKLSDGCSSGKLQICSSDEHGRGGKLVS